MAMNAHTGAENVPAQRPGAQLPGHAALRQAAILAATLTQGSDIRHDC
jgi:hypothetical protein